MRLWLLLIALAAPASAGVVEGTFRAAPAAVSAAGAAAPSVNFDGGPSLTPLVPLPGTPYFQYGPTLIDTRAPGASELMKSVADPMNKPMLGLFETERVRVINAYAMGSYGVLGHIDAVPPNRNPERPIGGWVMFLGSDGDARFHGSGAFPATITPAVERAVLRFVGARPAVETRLERLKRLWLRLFDEMRALLHS